MREVFAALALIGLFAASVVADCPVPGPLLYSVDLGSDLDQSDPNGAGNMDCGDIYMETAPTLVKDDDGPLPPYTGFPSSPGFASQPPITSIGNAPVSDYTIYFDLDASDQLGMEVYLPTTLVHPSPGTCGVWLEPTCLVLSYEDDGPAGWAVSGDVPTMFGPAHGSAVTTDEVLSDAGPFGAWSPANLNGVRDEVALGLGPNPLGDIYDDDVDALDLDQCRFHYFSVDHEANMGLDPGDIYMCDLLWGGQNRWPVLDDVGNLGIPDVCDVDAFEFCEITPDTYAQHFGVTPPGNVLVGLFSVDSDDPDTPNVDELGGLNPNRVYMSDLIGNSVGLATYGEDIDALAAVPEPGTWILLAIGGMLLLLYRRRS